MTGSSTRRRLLVGTSAHNSHVQNMVRALYETGSLYAYFSGGVDVWHGSTLRRVSATSRRSAGDWRSRRGRSAGNCPGT